MGITPSNDGKVIRLSVPQLSQERRQELAKVVHKMAEEGRVSLRTVRHESKAILEKLEKISKDGANFSDLRENWLQYFQTKLLAFYGVGQKNNDGFDLMSVKKIIDLLIEAGGREKLTQISQLPLELVVVDYLGNKPEKISDVRSQILEKKEEKVAEVIEDKKEIVVVGNVEEISKRWGEVLISVKPFNHSVEAFLRAARPLSMDKGILTLEVFYKFHKERLEESKNRQIVMIGLEKVLGKAIDFKCVLTKSTYQKSDNSNLGGQPSEQANKKDEEIFI